MWNMLSSNKGKSLSLPEAILVIAMLGGFVKGKGREPGVEVMWRGIRRLENILICVCLSINVFNVPFCFLMIDFLVYAEAL